MEGSIINFGGVPETVEAEVKKVQVGDTKNIPHLCGVVGHHNKVTKKQSAFTALCKLY